MNATTVRPFLSCLLLLAATLAPAAPSALAAPAEQAAGGAGVHFQDSPASLGHTMRIDLRGNLAPPPPWIPAGETQQSDEDQPQ
jgi:hypothetical protein